MTIDKAIEILKLDKTCDFGGDADELEDAIQLGIEALKRVKAQRGPLGGTFDLGGVIGTLGLPGETE